MTGSVIGSACDIVRIGVGSAQRGRIGTGMADPFDDARRSGADGRVLAGTYQAAVRVALVNVLRDVCAARGSGFLAQDR